MKTGYILILLCATLLFVVGCNGTAKYYGDKKMGVQKQTFGKTADGREFDLYTLTNANGLIAKVTNYGATLTSLQVPDRIGRFADIVLGYDKGADYVKDNATYFGGTVGRCANFISKGRFTLNGKEYCLALIDLCISKGTSLL